MLETPKFKNINWTISRKLKRDPQRLYVRHQSIGNESINDEDIVHG